MKSVIVQIFSSFIIAIGNFLNGYSVSWFSDALSTLQSSESPLGRPITEGEENLVGSMLMLGCFVAIIFTGWLADTIGRKKTGILAGLGFVVAWSTMTTASNVPLLLIARFIVGISSGIQLVVSIPFISELSEPRLKGTNTSLAILLYLFGILVAYVNGWLLSYQVINYFNLTLSVIYVVLLSFWKETPVFLLKFGKVKEALESLKFYRGVSKVNQEVLDEFEFIRSQCDERTDKSNKEIEATKLNQSDKGNEGDIKEIELSAWKTLCTSKSNRRAVTMLTLYIVLLVFGGTLPVLSYAGPLFKNAAPGLSPHLCSIALSIAFILGGLMTTVINRFVGRRILMISSAVLSAWFLAILASLLRWDWGPEYLIPASMLAYCMSFQMGVGNVTFIQLSEIFGPKVKSLATVIMFSTMCFANFVLLAIFNPIKDSLGLDGTFFLFSSICMVTAIVSYLTLKETKDKSVEEIQDMYEKSWFY